VIYLSESSYDVFVCFYEDSADDFAERVHRVLTERGYKVFVSHLKKGTISGDYHKVFDSIINNCKIFLLLNTIGALKRDEVKRETRIAFPNRVVENHEFWPYRNQKDPSIDARDFQSETGIDLQKIHQPFFGTAAELARLLIERCENVKRLTKQDLPTQNNFPSLLTIKIKLSPSSLSNQDAIEMELKEELKKGNFTRATELYDLLLEHDPLNASLLNGKGIAYGMVGQYPSADQCFSMALELNKNSLEILGNKAISLHSLNRNSEALSYIERALSFSPGNNQLREVKAFVLFSLGKYTESLEIYNKILLKSESSKILSSKASVLNVLGDRKAAYQLLSKAIDLDPKNDNAWYNLAVMLFEDKKYEEALKNYDAALQINPYNHASWNNKGVILRILGRYDEAIKHYDEAIKIDPTKARTYHNKGLALSFFGNYKESIEYFDKAIQLDSNYADAYANKAVSLDRLGKFEDALGNTTKALELKQDNLKALANAVLLSIKLKKFENAEIMLRKILELNPNDIPTINDLAIVLYEKQQFNEALEIVNSGLKIESRSIMLLITKGSILINLGQYDEGIKNSNSVLEIDGKNPLAYYNKACAYALKGIDKDAIQLLEKAISLDEAIKVLAREEKDFGSIRTSEKFKKLLE